MRKIYTLIFLSVCTLLQAQDAELKGTVIGTTYSVDYSSSSQSTTVNTKAMAFDNDLSTFFASYDRSNTWVGLDLGKKCVITKVAFASRSTLPARMQLGVFEGANSADFTDAVPIYVIKDIPSDNVLTTVNITCTEGFRYVRYVGPNDDRCNVAELKFYGHAGDGDNSKMYQLTNIPTVVIHTVNAEAITSKEVYVQGIVSTISNDGTTYFTDSINIRGRGNASWSFDKKPYKMKLFHKAHVLGMPAKAKDWTFISNEGDKTLIRNAIAFQMSRDLEMAYTPACTMVDVFLNGEYEGCYQLCDQVEINKNRINITEMTTSDTGGTNLTGGYHIEIDAYADAEPSKFYSSTNSIPVTIKNPGSDDIQTTQFNYIKNYFDIMVNRVFAGYYNNPTYGYRLYLDLTSFLKYFLVGEASGNTDTFWSTNMYKDRDSIKFYTGPVWDFDIAFENDSRTHPISSLTDFIYRTKGSYANGMLDLVNRIVNTSSTEQQVIWSRARHRGGLTAENLISFVDSMTTLIDESQKLNFTRWPILSTIKHMEYEALGSYSAEVQVVKDFINEHITWMDNKIGLLPDGIETTTVSNGKIIATRDGISLEGYDSDGNVAVYDTSGQQIANENLIGGSADIKLQRGIYIIKVEADGKSIRQKVLIK